MSVVGTVGILAAFDWSVSLALNELVGRAPLVDRVIFHLADMDLLKGVPFMACGWYFWFSRGGAARRHVVDLMVGALLAIAAARLLQLGLPPRLRPLNEPALDLALATHVNPEVLQGWSSFPSDHATLFFALAVGLAPMSPVLALAAMAWVSVIVCLPRLYLGYHYATDLIAGAILGIVVAALYPRLAPKAAGAAVVRISERWPGLFAAAAFIFTFELSRLMGGVRQLGSQMLKLVAALGG